MSYMIFLSIWSLFMPSLCCSSRITKDDPCWKHAPINYSKNQRDDLCSFQRDSPMPSLCAKMAHQSKSIAQLRVDEVIGLCRNISSLHQLRCLKELDNTALRKHGNQLCDSNTSSISWSSARRKMSSQHRRHRYPSSCYNYLVKLSTIRLSNDKVIDYCRGVTSVAASMPCIQEVSSSLRSIPMKDVLSLCKNTSNFSNHTAQCIKAMTQQYPSLPAYSIVDYCMSIDTTALDHVTEQSMDPSLMIACYNQSERLQSLGIRNMNAQTRMALCRHWSLTMNKMTAHENPQLLNDNIDIGAIRCAESVAISSKGAIDGDLMVRLCAGAKSEDPARCFLDSKGTALTIDERVSLCRDSSSQGLSCYRTAMKISTMNSTMAIALCAKASSADPALCMASAPSYLSMTEAMKLCSRGNMNISEKNPINCFKSIIATSKYLTDGSKRSALDYKAATVLPLSTSSDEQSVEVMSSRAQILSICASERSSSAAKCFETLSHRYRRESSVDHLLVACAATSSPAEVDHVLSCMELLLQPRHHHHWRMIQIAQACARTTSINHALAIDSCMHNTFTSHRSALLSALSLSSSSPLSLAVEDLIVRVCQHETVTRSSWHCMREAFKPPVNDLDMHAIDTIIDACSSNSITERNSNGNQTGQCLNDLLFSSHYRRLRLALLHTEYDTLIQQNLYSDICLSSHPRSNLKCLDAMNQVAIFEDDLINCSENLPIASQLRFKYLWSELENNDTNPHHITAGARFHIVFEVLDQWNDLLLAPASSYFRIMMSKRSSAKVWGITSNSSANGLLSFDYLAISQPGHAELMIIYGSGSIVASLRIDVKADPRHHGKDGELCIIELLSSLQCSVDDHEDDRIARYPVIRSYLPASSFTRALYCEDELRSWYILLQPIPASLAYAVDYRQGVDAIWLQSRELPQETMNHEERLQLERSQPYQACKTKAMEEKSSCNQSQYKLAIKAIRHQYYKLSLLWHPDRWIGMERYQLAVQGAFDLIAQSYQALLDSLPL
jgi:hypothetical protein